MKSFPSALSILLIISAFAAVLTWIIPAGTYATLLYDEGEQVFVRTQADQTAKLPATRETLDELSIRIPIENFTSGAIYKPIAIPDTYESMKARPQGFFEVVQAPIKGIIATSDIIFLVLFIGGLVGIVEKSGAFSAGIAWMSHILKGREYILIIVTTFLVGLGGTTFGFGEEGIAFLPILVPIFLAARYDAIIAVACLFLGSQVGVMTSTINPFATIIASDAAGITWTTGLYGRVLMFVICMSITIIFLLRYAKKVKADPSKSVIHDEREKIAKRFGVDEVSETLKLTNRHRLILMIFALCFVTMITGVAGFGWWYVEMTSVFLVGAILIGFISKTGETEFIDSFLKGAGSLLGVTFIIGVARGISIIMTDGLISDTILFHASHLTSGMNKIVFANVLFGIYNGLCFFISSTSGMAVLTMPIMAPLADTVETGRENIVNMYQFGVGIFNLVNPTSLILAFLGVAQIGYDRYLKFVWPLIVILAIVCMVFLTVTV